MVWRDALLERQRMGGKPSLVTMKNENGMTVSVTDYGATLVSIRVPEGDKTTDVVLGYDSATDYEKNDGFLGAVIGRNGNRIGTASFTLNGRTFQLEKNEKENNLHSGSSGFDNGFGIQRFWRRRTAFALRFTARMGMRAFLEIWM